MKYNNIKKGIFKERPNRFIAHIEIDGKIEVCHVKNTGRCRELLVPDATVYVEENNNPNRKTRFSLIGVEKGARLINMDSQAPNKVVREWLQSLPEVTYIKSEVKYGESRLDFYVETADTKYFIEVKGVTLEDNGVVRFPDAPTERGIKHMKELAYCLEEGYEACMIFVIQMNNVNYFEPNDKTHKAFGDTLREVYGLGVKILAMDCKVGIDYLEINKEVEVRL